MSRFAEQAQSILDAAASAAAHGNGCSAMTILIGADGAIRMCADSDWPLDSLVEHHGARAGYRVSGHNGAVRVEGREGPRTCLLETRTTAHVARMLLAGY